MNSTKQRSLPIQCQSRRGYHQYETASSSTGCSTKAEYDLKTWLMYNRIVQARLKSSKRGGSSGISYCVNHANDGSEILDTIQDSQAEPELIYDGEIFQLDLWDHRLEWSNK